jgi:tRNA (guanosine-2'-O-)-methyltransferase
MSLTPQRQARLSAAADQRTNYLRLIIQDIHNPHNVSACLRTAEAFGILNVDVVNLHEKFRVSSVARGVESWLNIRKWLSIEECVKDLKQHGYKLAAGFPAQNSLPLSEVPLSSPIAVIFGNEHDGVDEDWLPHIDYKFTIPMRGLVESLNISVSCGISLYEFTRRAKLEVPSSTYLLSTLEKAQLLEKWAGVKGIK